MLARLTRIWEGIVAELFDREGFDAVFTHARNVLTGAAVVAAWRSGAIPCCCASPPSFSTS